MAELPTRAGPIALTTASQTIKTAGAASTWIILRSILVTNTGATSATVTAGIGTVNTDAVAKHIATAIPVAPGQVVDLISPGFVVLAGGATPDLLYALASAAGLNITASQMEGP